VILGAIVALAGSLGKLKITETDLPKSFPFLVNYICSLSSTFDRRTFVSILRSLTALSVRWNVLSTEQKIGIAAGNFIFIFILFCFIFYVYFCVSVFVLFTVIVST
jgi:hypothetical protein